MSSPFAKVSPGQRLHIPAQAYNAFIDAALAHRNGLGQFGERAGSGAGTPLLVRNDSGAAAPRFGVLEVAGPVLDPDDGPGFANQLYLSGVAVTEPGRWYVLTLEPLAAGKSGRAVGLGLTQAIVNIASADHDHAETQVGSQVLVSVAAGTARILWAKETSGLSAAIIDLTGAVATGGLFAVQVATDGGDGGDYEDGAATPASWTYTVTSLQGVELATELEPEHPRPAVEMLAGGPIGVAYYDDTGELHLWSAGEVPAFTDCDAA